MSVHQIVSKEEMKQLERLTCEDKDISSFELLYQAGSALFFYIYNNNLVKEDDKILVVAGPGKNGGDALVIGEKLHKIGFNISVILIGKEDIQCDELIVMCSRLMSLGVNLVRVCDTEMEYSNIIENSTVIIDGLLGIGIKRDIEGCYKKFVNAVNDSYAKVISVDLPSGINANNGMKMGVAIKASDTLVVQTYKQGNLLNDALDYNGNIHLVDCGILSKYSSENQQVLSFSYLNKKIPTRMNNSYKYKYGNILTIGGSKGMMGAPLLSSYSALKSGSGLSSILIKDEHLRYFFNPYPEVMFDTFLGIEEIPSQVKNRTCIVFGPGLGKNDQLNLEILSYLLETNIPLVIDADGISYLKQLIKEYSNRENIVITPHYKEMADFLDLSVSEVMTESLLLSKNIAHKYNLTVVLKGACTIITNNDETFFSVNGNPGLASAGTGDVLAGIIASYLGRGIAPLESSKLGVLIHSKCALYSKNIYGEESMTATNLIEFLPKVIGDSLK